MTLFIKHKHRLREGIYGSLEKREGGIYWEFGIYMYTLLYLKYI